MREIEIIKSNENSSIVNIGEFDGLREYSYVHSMLNLPMKGKVFVGEKINASSMEISFQVLGPGKEIQFDHLHRENEEVYVVIKGNGFFELDGEKSDIEEGSIIRVAPSVKRRWGNNSDSDLIVMIIQAVDGSLNHYTVTDGYSR